MKGFCIILTLCLSLSVASCSLLFNVCIRNTTNDVATVDVFLPDKTNLKTLPNKIRVANSIINVRSGYNRHFDSTQNVTWIDIDHFKLEIQPKTTVDVSDMAGRSINDSPRGDAVVIVSLNNKTDTLLNGINDFRREKFNYTGGFLTPRLYYDIKAQETPSITTTISPLTGFKEK
jgi:hypothetical protein